MLFGTKSINRGENRRTHEKAALDSIGRLIMRKYPSASLRNPDTPVYETSSD